MTRPPSAPSIEMTDVSCRFGAVTALEEVSLSFAPGERIALAGPSGGGKSTLLATITGALTPSSGRVLVDGSDLARETAAGLRRHRQRCGIVPQGAGLVPALSVHHNVLLGLLPRWSTVRVIAAAIAPYAFARRRVSSILEEVGLGSKASQRARTLSGGERQRVAVARGLIGNPSLICADEPTASLDPHRAEQVLALMFDPAAPRSIMVSTHWLSRVVTRVDRVVGLRDGRVALDTPACDLDDHDLRALYAGSDELR
ncbi:MAG: ATP-binding cassette domain-containing protein [Myxococcota bacterium]